MRIPLILIVCLSFCTGMFSQVTDSEAAKYLEENYTKNEYKIPMRDGVKLFACVYSPRDKSTAYPVLMRRTPYSTGAYGKEYVKERLKSWHHLAKEGFIFVFQDVRGRFMSEGDFVDMRPHIPNKKNNKDIDESTDTYDVVDWLLKNLPNNNGKVGIWGISYPGFYAAMATIDAHPALKAISPQAPIADWFGGDDWHHHGAFSLSHGFPFLYVFGVKHKGLFTEWPEKFKPYTPDGYKFYLDIGPLKNVNKRYYKGKIAFWNDLMGHGTRDEYWKARNILPHFKNVKPAVMVVGGWFDAENCYGAINTYHAIEKLSPKANNMVVLGPWSHGGWVRTDGAKLGDVSFGSKTRDYYIKNLELPFFNYHLKGKGKPDLPEAAVFETGSNQWKNYPQWPPANTYPKKLFIDDNLSLSFEAPGNVKTGFDNYTSDPAKPVPFTSEIVFRIQKEYMVEDQRFAATRTDVLVYETEPLKKEITIAGPVIVDFYVSTTGTDSDWVVKLIDVFPDQMEAEKDKPEEEKSMRGFQMMLRGDILRGKFRNSLEKPEAMIPNKITHIKFAMNDLNHTFKKGHKIMVQVQSSWFPLFDRNPQTFVDIYNADESDFREAEQKVYFSKEYPSGIILNVLRNLGNHVK
ncbi:MAG: CocE/NonD family hydrolase [bacterium]|nr:CocE/NonD family hydrolase [bacterium]